MLHVVYREGHRTRTILFLVAVDVGAFFSQNPSSLKTGLRIYYEALRAKAPRLDFKRKEFDIFLGQNAKRGGRTSRRCRLTTR